MGVALGWLAAVLAASGPGAASQETGPQISYTFRSLEVRGLGWRDAALLKPVAQHNAVSVWTTPDDFLDRLPKDAKAIADAPARIMGRSQAPVHLTSRKLQDFVTRVVWKGKSAKPVIESVREGITATAAGRKLDQGILTQLVIDDVDVRSVHTLESPAVKQASASVKTDAAPCPFMALQAADKQTSVTVTVTASMDSDSKPKDADAVRVDWTPSKSDSPHAACKGEAECCRTQSVGAKSDAAAARAGWTPGGEGKIQIPEIGRASAAGEWLIPEGEVLVIGFGPHTVADADGKAVVREHLAVISAEVADGEAGTVRTSDDEPQLQNPAPATSEPSAVPRTATNLPDLPGRTLPQGVHPDGTPAPLPTLPEEADDVAPSDASAEPSASPQSRRKSPQPPKPAAPAAHEPEAAKTDAKATKSSFSLPAIKRLQAIEPMSSLVAASFLAAPFRRAQFLVPLKYLDLKLPFHQKLEFELVGRVVSDPAATGDVFAGN